MIALAGILGAATGLVMPLAGLAAIIINASRNGVGEGDLAFFAGYMIGSTLWTHDIEDMIGEVLRKLKNET